MKTFFEAKVKYSAIDESGKDRKKNVVFLIDAMSYTESEARLYAEMEKITSGDFKAPSMKESTYSDVFLDFEDDNYYEVKVAFVSVDEELGREKKMTNKMLISANSTKEAEERIIEKLKDMTVDYEVTSNKVTNIQDVFIYESDEA